MLKQVNDLVIHHYQIIPYKIQLKRPLHSTSFSLYFREGFLIELTAENGDRAIGECAPMIDIGTESLPQALECLKQKLPFVINHHSGTELLSDMNAFPACRFALECAFLSLIAQYSNKNIACLLNRKLLKIEDTPKFKVNSMLGALNSETLAQIKQSEMNGFTCIKIKLGLNPIKIEAEQLKEILQTILPATLIRLDANKSWTVKESEWFLNMLEPYKNQIDSIEEPLKIFDTTAYQHLQSKTTIALALDESFSSTDSLETFPVQRLILKPMAQGGLLKTLERVRQAQQLNIETIITSSIESGYGLWAISHLCAAVDNQQYHGIATASWLEDTLIKPPEIKHGIITL
ncbi:MAG: o-succinylbenzoate synthase [gamma proteobacterium symbiont of Bathyaustriella thionipta]|nr:o-succinylbenzoate synthase [gamma proteobacterium symbiont of Bathyaustriella thionipta]MCU7951634.1 o-succinylbenzoate synthase [gamma proteobacterium symbiont of Bathyaustriella thionipta]MCU7958224.1 o-succinylbenzoate synthase [gamma proteobacterium symbiont of Bathyaustriella thionipta]MCU7968406.1 o-succinylbenzoate synthase [gamma proteobacterium symbiont of Bathyaustriella thionipta]